MRMAAKGVPVNKRPPNPLLQQGLALHRKGQLAEALVCYRQLLKVAPHHAEALHMAGVAEFQRQNFDLAAQAIEHSLKIAGANPMAHFNFGNACRAMGRIDEALDAYGKAIELRPDYPEARINRGLLAFDNHHWGWAAADLAFVVRRQPTAPLLIKLGLACHQLKRFDEAAAAHAQAIALDPANPEACCHLGSALMMLERGDEALACYDQALALAPRYGTAYFNRGNALVAAGQWQQAADSYRQALACEPSHHAARIQLGIVLGWLGHSAEALAQFDQILAMEPGHALAHFHKGLELLITEDLEHGWAEYEWRLSDRSLAADGVVHQFDRIANDWAGEKLNGQLLVLPEQGLGDQIFHAALLTEARNRTEGIIACVDDRLISLFSRSMPEIEFISPAQLRARSAEGSLQCAAQIQAGSLGRYLRADPLALQRVGSPYLRADQARANALRARLQPDTAPAGLHCGIAWHSKNAQSGNKKSLDLIQLAPVLSQPDVHFVDLQYGDTTAERTALKTATGIDVMRLDDVDNLRDIDGLAALIDACDLVITVSNSTAHLAAALGKPVLVMLADGPGLFWFWHRDRDDSPWYPSARLLRQTVPGNWSDVVTRASAELAARAKAKLS